MQTDEGAEDADAAVEERRAAKALKTEAEGHAQTDEGAEDADAAVKERRSATLMPRYVSANYYKCVSNYYVCVLILLCVLVLL